MQNSSNKVLEDWALVGPLPGHFVGRVAGVKGYVKTSDVSDYDPDTESVITVSGSRYQLGTPSDKYEACFPNARERVLANLIDWREEKHLKWINSLPLSDRRRQLYHSEKTPWQIFMPRHGWVNGGPCDAIAALFKLGTPIRLGEWSWAGEDIIGNDMRPTAKKIMEEFEPDPTIRDTF